MSTEQQGLALELAERPELLAIADGRVDRGRAAARDVELVDRVKQLVAGGCGVKRGAKMLGIGADTFRGIRDRLEAAGEVRPLKERLSKTLMRAAEDAWEEWHEAVRNGDIEPGQIPVGAAIAIDKSLLLSGEATAITEVRMTGPTLQDVRNFMRDLAAVEVASDVRSGETVPFAGVSVLIAGVDTQLDTAEVGAGTVQEPDGVARTEGEKARTEGAEGGGGESAAGDR